MFLDLSELNVYLGIQKEVFIGTYEAAKNKDNIEKV